MTETTDNPRTYNILVVEDNPAHAQIIIRSLGKAKVNTSIFHAEDGELALEFMHHTGKYESPNQPPRPDLILLDLKLPKVSGHAVLYDLKTDDAFKTIPVVMLTTSDADTDVSTAYDNRANSYLTKPVDFAEFTKVIEDLANYWLVDNTRSVTEVLT